MTAIGAVAQEQAPAPIAAPRTAASRSTLAVAAVLAVGLWTNDWLAGAGIAALGFGWWLLGRFPGPPVLPLAFTHQWAQVMIGLFYFHATGRKPLAMTEGDCRPMMIVGLVTICTLAIGVWLGARRSLRDEHRSGVAAARFGLRQLVILYALSTVVSGAFLELTRDTAFLQGLYQGAVYLSYSRLAVLFLLCRRLLAPRLRLGWFALVVLAEVALGVTGYFAGFREVLVVAGLAVMEIFDRRRAVHWVTGLSLAALLGITGVVWQGIKGEYRARFNADAALAASRSEKFDLVIGLADQWLLRNQADFLDNLDLTVDRLWQVYYPSLALKRVPHLVPHTGGTFAIGAMMHVITPRFFFEDKGALLSDSEKVRKYAGVNVAGMEEGTSIAFGYAAESYVDFGIPLMFVPVLAFGWLMGALFSLLRRVIDREELATASSMTIFWLSLYLFERSWDRSLGMSVTLFLFIGGATFVLDRILIEYRASNRAADRDVVRPVARRDVRASPA